MKKIRHILSVVLLAALALTSCLDDDLVKTSDVEEGKPVTVSLKIGYRAGADVVVNTRADNTLSDIARLRILVYDSQGNYMESLYYTNNPASDEITLTNSSTSGDGHWYTAKFKTTSGTRKLIAVANAGGGYWQAPSDIENTTYEDMKKAVISLSDNLAVDGVIPYQITVSSQMLLTGCQDEIVFTTDNRVTDMEGSDLSPAISLRRAMARVTFKIPETISDATGVFTPTTYQVYNVPIKTMLSNDEKEINGLTSAESFINFASVNVPSVYDGFYTFSFYMPENVYDVVESVKDSNDPMSYKDRDTWSGDPGSTADEKTWTNAPQYSTFVVLSGTYSEAGEHNYTGNVSYTIHLGDFSTSGAMGDFSVERNTSYTYTVNVKGVENIIVEAEKDQENQPGAEGQIFTYDATTYSYELDAHYEQVYLEYNLSEIAQAIQSYTVNGKLLGAYNKDNPQSDEDIDDAIAANLILVIQSEAMDYSHAATDEKPYSVQNKRGTLRPYKIYADAVRGKTTDADKVAAAQTAKNGVLEGAGTGIEPTQGFDYKWIEFWPQSDKAIAKYPGVSKWSREDLEGFSNSNAYGGDPTEESGYLKDVYDVIVAMGKVVKKIYKGENILYNSATDTAHDRAEDGITIFKTAADEYTARFTAFVNEYYYYRHPLTGEKVNQWSVFTNKIPREMIIAMSSSISTDGNSSYSTIYSYITQLSMQTFYNSRVADINGFGIETYNETPISNDFPFGNGIENLLDDKLDDSDGRNNQIYLIGANSSGFHNTPDNSGQYGKWEEYIAASKNGWTTSVTSERTAHKLPDAFNYKYASSSCLSRNRDLNGNGVIDDNEVRWYLASLNEYIRMSIGSKAISNAAQLYTGDKNEMKLDSYPSSYVADGALFFTSSTSGKRMFWAVEKGAYGGDASYNGWGKPLRCIRSLPANIDDQQDISSVWDVVATSTFEAIDATGTTPLILKFKGRLVDNLYRQPISDSFGRHNEDSDANLFSEGIFVASDYIKDWTGGYAVYSLGSIIGYQGATQRGDYYNNLRYEMANPCENYNEGGYKWRVPNLVELSAMNAAGVFKDYDGGVACCTYFSNQNVRYGFVRTDLVTCPGHIDYQVSEVKYRIRCVSDVPAGYFGN